MLMQAARPHLKKNKGAIVNFGSISSRVAQTGRWVYPPSPSQSQHYPEVLPRFR